MKIKFLLLFLAITCQAHSQSHLPDCNRRVQAAFYAARGGGFLIPEKYYTPQPGNCNGYYGRACGQFLVPYTELFRFFNNTSAIPSMDINKALGTEFKPGHYYLMYVNTSSANLHLRCPTRAELHDRDTDGECATHSDCGCNPKFVDGAGRTSGNVTEGFVDGLDRSSGNCVAVKPVILE